MARRELPVAVVGKKGQSLVDLFSLPGATLVRDGHSYDPAHSDGMWLSPQLRPENVELLGLFGNDCFAERESRRLRLVSAEFSRPDFKHFGAVLAKAVGAFTERVGRRGNNNPSR
jgi:hypothetical protein